ncbi:MULTISPECIES: hypothetical protein [Mycolicibacterium]|uniref:hypothetical protein n=1 Tax=Mycolicibacterium TaxID=1866885 RepID=UPI002606F097|nr:hypothetical protein [Mycolicibacterium fortuitum]
MPIQLKLHPRELTKAPQDLAHDIFELCQLSAMRAQVSHRNEMLEAGADPNVIRDFNLATEEELARAEARMRGGDDDDDDLPDTWLGSV